MADAPEVEVDVLVTAWFSWPEAWVFPSRRRGPLAPLAKVGALLRPGAPWLRCPCVAYVVRHPTHGTLLIDTGMHAQAASAPLQEWGLPLGLFFRAIKPVAPYDEQLRAAGVNPDSVGRVVMTHLHADHTSGLRLLPKAELVCDDREWAQLGERGAAAKGFLSAHLPPEDRVRRIDFAAEGEPHAGFEQTVDLLGDGSIRLVATPGHTAGHLSVLLRTTGGRDVLIAGDAVYTSRSLREGRTPLLMEDAGAYRRSLAQLQAFAAGHPDATIVPSHDPDAWRALAPAPA